MGREDVQSGALQAAPGNNFKLNARRALTGRAVMADGAMRAAVGLTSDLWAGGRRLLAIVAAGATALIVPFAIQPAAVNAQLHAALATMMTLFALAAAWLLCAQFASSRRGRDLLLLASTLALALITFGAAAVQAGKSPRGNLLRWRRSLG